MSLGTILIVDDEKAIVDILKFNLTKEGFDTICAYDGAEGFRLAQQDKPDLILLDVMLPYMDGFEVCKKLREAHDNVPIIMITAREEETDKVFGLELGADDYITKPFSLRELVAIVKTNMRRMKTAEPARADSEVLHRREISIDMERHAVFKNGTELELTQREYELIKHLAI